MKKIFLLAVTLGVVEVSFSQEEKSQYIRKGLLRSTATFSPGFMLKENVSTISIHGILEYYVADNVSLRGDSYYYLHGKDNSGDDPFDSNHSTFAGASYHFKTKNHFDPYIGFQPGISITQRSSVSKSIQCITTPCPGDYTIYGRTSVNPLISPVIGFNFYFQKWFHLFGEARYLIGKNISDDSSTILPAPTPLSLNELRFSFGLGFNLNLLKKK